VGTRPVGGEDGPVQIVWTCDRCRAELRLAALQSAPGYRLAVPGKSWVFDYYCSHPCVVAAIDAAERRPRG
jgi:hypothetical protein